MTYPAKVIISNWSHYFEDISFSSDDFYLTIKQLVESRKFPDVSVRQINLLQGTWLLAERQYLRVRRRRLIFDICAAPYGTGFFVSWWLGENPSALRILFRSIPIIGLLIREIPKRTYFQMDTDNMFRNGVHQSVLTAIDEMTNAKGLRLLSDFDRKPENNRK